MQISVAGFKALGIKMSYCPSSMCPEIPTVTDVLYALQLNKEQRYYSLCSANHSTYVVNVHLVATAVAYQVLSMRPYDEAQAKQIIVQAIRELAPEGAPLHFDPADVVNNVLFEGQKVVYSGH